MTNEETIVRHSIFNFYSIYTTKIHTSQFCTVFSTSFA